MHTDSVLAKPAAAAAALALLCGLSLPASADVSSRAVVAPRGTPNNPNDPDASRRTSDFRSNTGPNYSFHSVSTGIGFASAGGRSGPGTLSGQAVVLLSNDNKYMSGALSALVQASTTEIIPVKRLICDEVADFCANLVDLGIDKVRMFVPIHASGGTASSVNSQFNSAESSADFSWTLHGALGGSISGGGGKSSRDSGNVEGAINSQVISFDARPGTELRLDLNMTVFAAASVSGGWIGDVGNDHATAIADFSHTLRWMGVSSMQAFGADGHEIALPTGARMELLGSSGHDFWNAAPTVSSVPEPSAWLMLLPGLGLLAWRRRPGT